MSQAQDESSVASLYQDTAVAATYIQKRFSHSWGRLLHQRQVAAINRVIRHSQPARLVELAPGPARIAAELRGVHQGLMIEYSQPMLALAREHMVRTGLDSRWEFLHWNAFDLPTLQYQCDFLYTFRFIRHFQMPDRSRLYHGIYSSLRPGGLFMLDVVNRQVRERVDAKTLQSSNAQLQVYDVTYALNEFRQEIENYGFSLISMIPVVRNFHLQSLVSYTLDHRSKKLSKLIVYTLEFLPSKNPLEWIAIAQKKR